MLIEDVVDVSIAIALVVGCVNAVRDFTVVFSTSGIALVDCTGAAMDFIEVLEATRIALVGCMDTAMDSVDGLPATGIALSDCIAAPRDSTVVTADIEIAVVGSRVEAWEAIKVLSASSTALVGFMVPEIVVVLVSSTELAIVRSEDDVGITVV